ncbi:hypothetical protein HYW58_00865 [Candidatus Kaiserbacteria bacterium]|nr:hypothetical protein [Candidatus Kaiserbacteria bacterium]
MKDFLKHLISVINARLDAPFVVGIKRVLSSLSRFETVVLWTLVGMLILSGLNLLSKANGLILVEAKARGGSFTEGIVGSPRFINPVLALSDADRDLASLVYSGLMKATPEGEVVEDAALNYSISPDGLSYEFTIREDALFHDGEPVTADDVIFTINKTLDPAIKSAQRANWDGVKVEKVDEHTVRFVLQRPYAPFLQNTTMGILPKHLWQGIDSGQFPFSEMNVSPVGSGPYKVKTVKKDSTGIPEVYILASFNDYALGKPYIKKITLRFYSNETDLMRAFKKGAVDAISGISPESIGTLGAQRIERSPLPRIFGVFFNQNSAQIFSHKEVRAALNAAIDKNMIVDQVLSGYGTSIDSPIPPGSIDRPHATTSPEETRGGVEEARNILGRSGWTFNEEEGVWTSRTKEELRFSLSTSNVPELKAVANMLKEMWEKVGAQVDIKVFEAGNLNQNVIRPREYDALLFGEVIGRELDLFAFWHSSQRNDPGLNIALYANITADALLEKGRTELDAALRETVYLNFEKEIKKDVPAVFLYSPDFIYILPEYVRGVLLTSVTTSKDRFLNVHEWYIRADKVWGIFSK